MLLANNAIQAILPQVLFIGGVILLMYFMIYLPRNRKIQQQNKFREELKVGDDVVTIGGLRGKIHALDAETITISADKHTKLVFDKFAISQDATKRLQAAKK
jgi:preprotein translocase subunit YajC